jgi:hypothetical protein
MAVHMIFIIRKSEDLAAPFDIISTMHRAFDAT